MSRSKYAAVSDAYARAVHSVLTKEEDAREATEKLEKQIIGITGLKPASHRAGK